MKLSICIPTYEYRGFGVECLEYSFNKMLIQTFTDFSVVISDHSIDNKIELLCNKWSKLLDIKYMHNEKDRGNPASNANNAIENCDGEWIRFLCQDDYLIDDKSLQYTVKLMAKDVSWIAHSYVHTYDRKNYENYHMPSWNNNIMVVNTIGTPSCIAFRNLEDLPKMDTNLSYYYDTEFYYQMFLKYGQPRMGYDVTMANYLWKESITSGVSEELERKEINYILNKYGMIQ